MFELLGIGVLVLAYFIGSIPFGLIIVRLTTGKDVRFIESGRTGGTNVARAAGAWAGVVTAVLDFFKAACSAWLARAIPGSHPWIEMLAPVAAILGHNYSIYLVERNENGKLRLRGGAGGASCVGGSFGLWSPSLFFVLPLGGLILYFVGYASVATISVAVGSILVFLISSLMGITPWQYVFYGVLAGGLMVWSLRPNIKRLFQGNERVVGFRARKRTTKTRRNYSSSNS